MSLNYFFGYACFLSASFGHFVLPVTARRVQRYNNIGPVGAKYLAVALMKMSGIKRLYLVSTSMDGVISCAYDVLLFWARPIMSGNNSWNHVINCSITNCQRFTSKRKLGNDLAIAR
jgi:hypothetical protein